MADEIEIMAPLQLARVASSVPWSLVALILMYGGLSGTSIRDKIIGFGGAIVLTVVAWRAARLRLLLGPDVVVVGWLGSKHYPWSEIDKFVVNDKGLAMRMRGGLEVPIPAFPMGGAVFKKVQASMQADLEQNLERAEKYRRRRAGRT